MYVSDFFKDVDSKGLAKDISSMSNFLQTANKKFLEELRSIINFTSIKDYSAFLCSKGAPFQALFPQLVKLMHVAHDCTSNFGICRAQFQLFTTGEDLASINYDSGSSEQWCTSTCKPMSDI